LGVLDGVGAAVSVTVGVADATVVAVEDGVAVSATVGHEVCVDGSHSPGKTAVVGEAVGMNVWVTDGVLVAGADVSVGGTSWAADSGGGSSIVVQAATKKSTVRIATSP
jgi:hypothetical protein